MTTSIINIIIDNTFSHVIFIISPVLITNGGE